MLRAGYDNDAPWVISPRPYFSELLSSFLVRVAHAHGLSPYRFCSFHFPHCAIWNRDIDRSANDDLLYRIAVKAQTSVAVIRSLTLQDWEVEVGGGPSARRGVPPAVTPWINVLGIFHRTRRRYGMQYCPHCLQEDVFYQKIWRLSFVTVCTRHACPLLDCCSRCQAPVAYHRNDAFYLNCGHCGYPLSLSKAEPEQDITGRLVSQMKFLGALELNFTVLGQFAIPSREFFQGVMVMLQIIKTQLRNDIRHRHVPPLLRGFAGVRIEAARVSDRAQQCVGLSWLLEEWPERFYTLTEDLSLNRRAFVAHESMPTWLRDVVEALPEGRGRVRSTQTLPLRLALRRLHRNKVSGWRTQRARLLFGAVGNLK